MSSSIFLAVAGAAAAGAAAGAYATSLFLRHSPSHHSSVPSSKPQLVPPPSPPPRPAAVVPAPSPPSHSNSSVPSSSSSATFGLPSSPFVERDLGGFVVGYDQRLRVATWAYERLSASSISGDAKRSNKFEEDSGLSPTFRARVSDYRGTGLDRGHLVPAADLRDSQESMDASFLLSNIVPQDAKLNRGYWKRLEDWVRGLTMLFEEVHVITGPLFLAGRAEDGTWQTRYKMIGHGREEAARSGCVVQDESLVQAASLPVPTHFYKVVLARKSSVLWPFIAAFVVPNEPVDETAPLHSFAAPVPLVESLSGHLFFPKLLHHEDKKHGPVQPKDLCEEISCAFVSKALRTATAQVE